MANLRTFLHTKDPLTGALNINGFFRRLFMAIRQKKIGEYQGIFFNIHNFNIVNKELSYFEGDKVLVSYCKMLAQKLTKDEVFGRLGGDNFVALIRKEHTGQFIQELQGVHISYESSKKNKDFIFSITAGIADLTGITNPGEFMIKTSVAYQGARENGAGSILYFNKELLRSSNHAKEVLSRFPTALKNNELEIVLQPVVGVFTKTICAAEALVRWNRDGNVLQPKEFIPILEKTGNPAKLDLYVVEQVCRLLNRWTDEKKPLVRISSNVSRKSLSNPDFAGQIIALLDKYAVPHHLFEVELTESDDFLDFKQISSFVRKINSAGISVSIDGFGTGYSSLSLIKNMQVNSVKIGRSFIPGDEYYPNQQNDLFVLKSIIDMMKGLHMDAVAKGVETEKQLETVRNAGCSKVQGFVYDTPLSIDAFEERLKNGYV